MSEEQEATLEQVPQETETMDTNQTTTEEVEAPPPTQEGATPEEDMAGVNNGKTYTEEDLKIFVGGVNWITGDEDLKQYFSSFGPVKDVILKRDAVTKKSRGFGFVVFETKEGVDKAIECKTHLLHERNIDVKKAIPHDEHQAQKIPKAEVVATKVFVGGVPKDMTKETLEEFFSKFGEVDEVAIINGPSTKDGVERERREFVFVSFKDADSVKKCLSETTEGFHTIGDKKVEVKLATPKKPPGSWKGGRDRGGMGRNMPYGNSYRGGYGGGGGGYGGGGGWDYSQSYGGGGGAYGGYGNYGGSYGGTAGGYADANYGGGGYDNSYYSGNSGGYGASTYGGYGTAAGSGRGGVAGGRGSGGGRYGPMKTTYNHSSGGANYHPYSR